MEAKIISLDNCYTTNTIQLTRTVFYDLTKLLLRLFTAFSITVHRMSFTELI